MYWYSRWKAEIQGISVSPLYFTLSSCSIGNTASLDIPWSLGAKVFRPVWTSPLCSLLQYLSTLETFWNLFLWHLPSSAFHHYSASFSDSLLFASKTLSKPLYWEFDCSHKFLKLDDVFQSYCGEWIWEKDAGRQTVCLNKHLHFIVPVWSPMCITWNSLCSCTPALQGIQLGLLLSLMQAVSMERGKLLF